MTEAAAQVVDDAIEFVSLTSGGQGFCIDIQAIREIRRWAPVTSLPHADRAVLGVMNLRGAVIPIIDLAQQLGLTETQENSRNVVLVVQVSDRTIGLLVEAVSEILTAHQSDIRNNPVSNSEGSAAHITGLLTVEENMLRVLDLAPLFEELGDQAA